MALDRRIAVSGVAAVWHQTYAARCHAAAGYWALTKPESNFLIPVATFAGFYIGCPTPVRGFPFLLLLHTLLGTMLVAGGAGVLNQYVERDFDARMRRTARRPLVAGWLEPREALRSGVLLCLAGGAYLAAAGRSTGVEQFDDTTLVVLSVGVGKLSNLSRSIHSDDVLLTVTGVEPP
jgi:heme O synthase-like polyprenyltransferase